MSIFLHHKKVVCQYSNNYICQIYKWGQIYSTAWKKNIYIYAPGQNFWCERGSQMKWITRNLNPVADFYCRFKQLGLERELIKVQANLDAEMNMRNQANTAKADLESE